MEISQKGWEAMQNSLDERDQKIRDQRALIDNLQKKEEKLLEVRERLVSLVVRTELGVAIDSNILEILKDTIEGIDNGQKVRTNRRN